MRLIDADELKKALDEQMNFEENCRDSVFDIIDNAPTVEAKTTHDVNSAYDRGFITAMKEYSRPKGEWIIVDDVYCECPFCKNREVKFSKHCPECGARLEGGAE